MITEKYDEYDRYKYIKDIRLVSKSYSIIDDLENFASRKKLFNNFKSFLVVDGNFADEVGIEQLDLSKDYSRCFVEDLDKVSYVFYLYNTDSSQYGIIEKDGGLLYDLKLLKNSNLNYDNVDICRTGNVSNFKFGRFITDNKTFISVFLANDVCYQLLFNSDELLDTKPILDKLNKVDDLSFKKFTDIVDECQEGLDLISLKIYKDFETIGVIEFTKEEKTKQYAKTIDKNGK